MTVALLGAPAPLPADPSSHPGWDFIKSTWLGWDNSLWNMTEPDQGVFHVRGGMRGLGMPKFTHMRDRSPAVPGAFWRGLSYDSREAFWPVHLFSDSSSAAWVERDAAWWKSLHPEHEGLWTIEVPGVSRRSLRLRLETDNDWAPEMDPTFYGWSSYGVTLTADQPFWEGSPILTRWLSGTPPLFHGGLTVGAPIINIASGRLLTSATVTNPGDVETDAIWTVYGPCTGVTITLAGRTIVVPVTMTAGQWIRIDTRPTENTVVNQDGTDVFSLLTSYDPVRIPPSGPTSVGLNMTGTLSSTSGVTLELIPLFHRAWGPGSTTQAPA